jgi:hypothetical protein
MELSLTDSTLPSMEPIPSRTPTRVRFRTGTADYRYLKVYYRRLNRPGFSLLTVLQVRILLVCRIGSCVIAGANCCSILRDSSSLRGLAVGFTLIRDSAGISEDAFGLFDSGDESQEVGAGGIAADAGVTCNGSATPATVERSA